MLRQWREAHHQRLRRENNATFFPEISLMTMSGLLAPNEGSFRLSGQETRLYRDQVLHISNPWDYPLRDIDMLLSFPERIAGLVAKEAPPSVRIVFEKPPSPWQVHGTGTATGNLPPGRKAVVGFDLLPPRKSVRLIFRTLLLERDKGRFDPLPIPMKPAFDYHLTGSVQIEIQGRWLDRRFAVPLEYSVAARLVQSHPCQSQGSGLSLRIWQEFG
jgi:hypothetical protein